MIVISHIFLNNFRNNVDIEGFITTMLWITYNQTLFSSRWFLQWNLHIFLYILFFYFSIFAKECLNRGLATVIVAFPATSMLGARARFCLSASHTKEHLDRVSTLFNVHCILYIVYCTLYTVHYILYIVYCTLYTVHCILYITYCTLSTVHCLMYIVYCTLYTVHNILCIVYCTLYTVHRILYHLSHER